MITVARIRAILNRRPFRPVRLFLSDGSSHAVPHPEFAWVFGGRVFVGVPAQGAADLEAEVKELSLLHLTRIEEIRSPKARRS